ncbi:hypothetical protein [Methanospirillum sp.]|uniref:hypothetical protein n=1 Tax=Methanospirillum sp. TaxID=45200 RepID=UPI002987F2A7|nr:hypothetical protein [Methanospirillum sp.]
MKITSVHLILILLTGFIITGVQGETISVQPITLSPGESGTVNIILDSAPSGLSGYQMTVQSDNTAIGTVTEATFPSWAALSEAVSGDGGSYALRAIDLNSEIEAGAKQVTFATLSIQASGSGTAQITIKNLQIDDDAGNSVQAEIKPGLLTVQGSTPPDEPSTEEYSVSLQTGWNLINIPMQPADGFEHADVFKNIQSAGHSMLIYDSSAGWITIGKNDQLSPMTGYWLYTTNPVTIPLKVRGLPIDAKALNAGWNLAGISGKSAKSAETALSGLSSWSYVVTYDSSSQQYRDAGVNGGDNQAMLTPGEGFWVYLNAPETLTPGT